MGPLAAVLLAAGRGVRFGSDKLAAEVGGRSLLAHALGAWNAWQEPAVRILVTRSGQALPAEARGWLLVENPRAAAGLGTSLAAGVAAAPVGTGAFVVGLADLPALDPGTLRALAAAWRGGAGPLLRPTWRGRDGHPVLAAGSLRDRLVLCSGDEGARGLIAALGCARVPVEDPGAVLDVDRPEDLADLVSTALGLRWKEARWPSPS